MSESLPDILERPVLADPPETTDRTPKPESASRPAEGAPAPEAERRPRRRRRSGQGALGSAAKPGAAGPSDAPVPARPPRTARGRSPWSEESPRDSKTSADHGEGRDHPPAAAVRDDGAPADIDPSRLDPDGLKILDRLLRFGHQAYFVGGCVRDLLLDQTPKDFDIATSAHPGEVRSLFRQCRLIGRRFRLAHVYFRGGKVVEVSTFRDNPSEAEEEDGPPEDLLITQDNVFGTAEQDARRRDFTVNGLFYDIRLGRVIDYVGGLADHRARVIRTIGDPETRMREDPVRILRAVRFATRHGFDLDPSTYAAMESAVEDLPRCARPRLVEEVFRLLRGGTSREAIGLLHALGALRLLLPPIAAHLDRTGPAGEKELLARLGALDVRMRTQPLEDALIVASLLAPLTRGLSEEDGEQTPRGQAIDALLEDMVQTARLPRRVADRARGLLWAKGVLRGDQRRRRSMASFRHHPAFEDALVLLEIAAEATGEGRDLVEQWKSGQPPARPVASSTESSAGEPAGEVKRRRRRRRRGSGPGSDSGGGGSPPEGSSGGG